MNVRLAVHLVVSIALALGLVFTGFALGGPLVALLAFGLWFLIEALFKALLPASFLPGVEGAELTSAAYRGWAPKLVGGLGLAKARTPEADAARLAAGVRLCTVTFGLRNGSQLLGHLLLQRAPEGEALIAWRGRGKGQAVQPIAAAEMVVRSGQQQQNAVQARMGYTVSVQFGPDSYWLRPHDAELLKLVRGHETAPAA
ncbi:hypothetical protein KCMC57_up50970 [Kitasatospora sp. CMC57]|uniref:Uncharacterized protein n=1 Tax=Kitasatospora sp. CMC57 TaxID=3231513 RepID=A0AB33K4H3_9ACTN